MEKLQQTTKPKFIKLKNKRNSFFKVSIHLLFLLFLSCNQSVKEKDLPEIKDSVKTGISRSNKTFVTDCRSLLAEARKMDSILLRQNDIDKPSATMAIKAFEDYATYCHNDTLSPVYLIKSAQVARAIENIPQAKTSLDQCLKDYPQFKNRPAALFLLAQLYDEQTYLNNESEAKKIYQQIIDEYPNSDWALSAKGAISFIGKSDEQIMNELKKTR